MTPIERTRASLLARLSGDADRATWLEFFDAYGPLVHGYARGRGLQPVDADDVVQEVLLSLMRAMPGFRYDPARGRFRGYLRTVTARAISARIRQNRPAAALQDVELSDPALSTDDDAVWEDEWRRYHVRRAMRVVEGEFGERDRLAFTRYAVNGDPPEQTARELGMSVDQVYQAKSRILRRLSTLIEARRRGED
ncbi:MAG: sigma-70 family RNA polymerase sigma factor [Planctomycetota bacterium JB042]